MVEVHMNIKHENDKLIDFWNHQFESVEPMELSKEDFPVEKDLNRLLKAVGDTSKKVIDVGSGWGYGIIAAKLLGSMIEEGYALDPSQHALHAYQETLDKTHITGLKGICGTHEELKAFTENTFDGVICSNVLDVVPLETSMEIIDEIKRVLKSQGLCLLKFNFFLDDALIERIHMEKIDEDTYTINGVIRGLNKTTDAWISIFSDFQLIEKAEFDRIPNGPKDRVLLLRKK
jgi:ubiquinone/menaquinone biosynthesis C-methylase UbiE